MLPSPLCRRCANAGFHIWRTYRTLFTSYNCCLHIWITAPKTCTIRSHSFLLSNWIPPCSKMLRSKYPLFMGAPSTREQPFEICHCIDFNVVLALRFGNLFMACIDNQLQFQSDTLLRNFIKDQVRTHHFPFFLRWQRESNSTLTLFRLTSFKVTTNTKPHATTAKQSQPAAVCSMSWCSISKTTALSWIVSKSLWSQKLLWARTGNTLRVCRSLSRRYLFHSMK